MSKALDNVRILDLTQVWFGPYCTMLLADMGADVIKIEPPWGEISRMHGYRKGVSPFFSYYNRGKRGITLNLKDPKGNAIFKELLKKADLVVENFSPGTMDRLGLGYDALREVNPEIIFASLSGFGQTGPYSRRVSYAIVAESYSGYTFLQGDQADPNGPPVRSATESGDLVPALFATIGILAALYNKKQTGHGQRIDVAQLDCMIALIPQLVGYFLRGTIRPSSQNRGGGALGPACGIFKAADGYVSIFAMRGPFYDTMKKVLGVEEIKGREVMDEWVGNKTVDEIVRLLVEARVPVAPCYSLDQVATDPQVLSREMIAEVEHPEFGPIKMPNFPIKFSDLAVKVERPAPSLGQHNEQVLSSLLGYTKEEIEKLKEEQVL